MMIIAIEEIIGFNNLTSFTYNPNMTLMNLQNKNGVTHSLMINDNTLLISTSQYNTFKNLLFSKQNIRLKVIDKKVREVEAL